MSRHPGLTLENNTYLVRVVVPADVRSIIGKRELIRSLATGDYGEAVKRWGPVYKEFKAQIAHARARGEAVKLDTRAATMALSNWGMASLNEPVDFSGDSTETPWIVAQQIAGYQKAADDPDGWRSIPNFDAVAADMLTKGGLPTREGDPIIAAMRGEISLYLAYGAREAERRRLIKARERLLQAAKGSQLDDVGVMPERPSKRLPAPSMTIQKLYDDWVSTLRVSDKERGRLDHQIRRLIEFVGDIPANHLGKEQIREFMKLVSRFPGRKRPPKLNALPIRELVAAFERQNAERPDAEKWKPLAETTVGEWFGGYRRMFDHAVGVLELVDTNPFDKLKRTVVRGGESVDRREYKDAEITAIFTKPMFQGFAGDGKQGYRDQPGDTILKDSKYWLPIIALFHGARLTEMAEMPLADFKCVKREDGEDVWYFDLTNRKVKTDGSQRLIPLHPHMLKLGWLEHVEALRKVGATWLFPDLLHENPRGPGHELSKWWGNWCDKNGFNDPTITFHSWRHTWKRRARQSDVKEEMHDVISGHKGQAVSRGYGRGADIEPLARDMALIEFPMFPSLPV